MTISNHYVNNVEMYKAMQEYRREFLQSQETGSPPPKISNFIGECFIKIATKFSYTSNGKVNFLNHQHIEDMIGDGVENCVRAINSFDPNLSNNPFSYFTQVIYYAFLRRISKEKRQAQIKNKMIYEMPFDSFELLECDETMDSDFKNSYIAVIQNNYFQPPKEEPKPKVKPKVNENSLEKFLNGE